MRFKRPILAKVSFGLAWMLLLVVVLTSCSRNPAAAVKAVLDRARGPEIDQQTMATAVTSLAAMGPDAVEPILQGMSDDDENISSICYRALVTMQGADSTITASAMSQQNERSLRLNAVLIIGQTNYQTRDTSLVTLMSDQDPKIRRLAAGMASRGDPRILAPALFRLLKSRKRTDVIAAIYSLARLLRKGAASALAELLVNPDAQIAGAAADALSEIPSVDNADRIAALMESPNLDLSVRALRALERMKSPVADAAVVRILKRLPTLRRAELISNILPTSKSLLKLVLSEFSAANEPAGGEAVSRLQDKQFNGGIDDSRKQH